MAHEEGRPLSNTSICCGRWQGPVSHNSGHQGTGLGELTRPGQGLENSHSRSQGCRDGRWQGQHPSPRRPSFVQVASRSKWLGLKTQEEDGKGWTYVKAEGGFIS